MDHVVSHHLRNDMQIVLLESVLRIVFRRRACTRDRRVCHQTLKALRNLHRQALPAG